MTETPRPASSPGAVDNTRDDHDREWWRHAVIYQIYPKSFADSDGDGVGDIAGIRSRLDYLAELGVDAIWVSPFYLSPQRDGGYDVTDYRQVDPLFGSVADVRELIAGAHDRGLRVIIDMVPNHTSDQHRFFQQALGSAPGSPEWGRYHCVRGSGERGEQPPNDWQSVFAGSAWDPVLDANGKPTGWWFLHLFDSTQPDVNWNHPEVQAEFADALRFWFDLGVDGFRIDVAMALVKQEGYPPSGELQGRRAAVVGGRDPMPQWDQPGVHDIWRQWRAIADSYQPPRVFVGEVHASDAAQLAPYLRPDELHMAFNFSYLRAPWEAGELRRIIDESLAESAAVGAPASWVIENHDFNRATARLARTAGFSLSLRVPEPSPELAALGLARARAALLFMLGLPGAAYIYQGQELGLPEVGELPDEVRQDPAFARSGGKDGFRDGVRVPLPWQRSGSSFGFGPEPAAPWLPQPADWGEISVAAQQNNPASTLELVRAALLLRSGNRSLQGGELHWLAAAPEVLLARRTRADAPAVDLVINMGRAPAALPHLIGSVLVMSGPLSEDNGTLLLPADTAAWLTPRLEPEPA